MTRRANAACWPSPTRPRVIRAEAALRAACFDVRVMGPPPDMRTGCDMVIEFELMREPAARRVLTAANLSPLAAAPVRAGMLEPVSLFQAQDFGPMAHGARGQHEAHRGQGEPRHRQHSPAAAARTCPPWPSSWWARRSTPPPRRPLSRGQTLCSYALELAFREAQRLLPGPA